MKRDSTAPNHVMAFGAAKINIGLHVAARRADGYHEVCGLVQTVSLADRLEITTDTHETDGVAFDVGAALRLRAPGAEELESGDNLVLRAARELAEHCEPRAVRITIEKAIPVAAGLGGGSADAAAAIAGLNVAWGARLRPAQLLELGARVGSDVPAILAGGLVHISGRGEIVRGLGSATEGAFVLGISPEHISAADAYAAFDGLATSPAAFLHHNDLEAAACEILPDLRARLDSMRDAGAGPVFVSGSGPTVVGVASSDVAARQIAARAHAAFDRIEIVRPSSWGVRVTIGSPDPALD